MPVTGEYVPSPSRRAADQVELFERTDGAEGNTMGGVPIVVVTMLGASSGKVRKTPLMRVEHDGAYALFASKGGAPEHPTWYRNLLAHPDVEVQDGAQRHDYRVREVHDDERSAWWERGTAVWPAYDEYQAKTDRLIPVLVAERSS
ncbi:nitroreductase family deazaflavin-dependent oxidoreductase [Cellulomonas sp. PhB143]|uniref:nitroreductase family deazaflavin-dependent oxidoreductase n=1 Tax=Cellulomonas sp. PhB143 TaxID=2485186 RepID=UPI000F460EB5|nr:nitroreductase family deazaflavin-dependent oxidoreductase [Cellulomonas sp. PhB143]ROS78808.1 deazaflavin-dependent oxidoreductase (nitroreductase family) [Cellulomonas sp. PhB143]